MLSTQAGDLPLIPDWSLPYTGTPGSGSAVLPAYIVTEDLIEYHWLGDPTPRIFQLGLPNSLTYQYVAVKFGAPVVKGANFAHYQVLVTGKRTGVSSGVSEQSANPFRALSAGSYRCPMSPETATA
jgi:hypothetical protein